MCFGAFIACTEYMLEEYLDNYFTHVYLHTDSDLLFSKKAHDYIVSNDIGFGSDKAPIPSKEKDRWGHAGSMFSDKGFLKFLSDQGLERKKIWRGSQEGYFFDIDTWRKIFSYAGNFLPWDDYYAALD